ncbi:Acetyltransferase (GNAT) family protein [Eubacterium uniforme]|uniref:Acetyltransferase (GNAT) family protein n=1 Tax=Eubacterium uniforme TaxID=39495 RepID=A0A1T4VVC9_9FIRM|nr:GNAT family N-acetyltransferase [Eubacterium uniforme]SKA68943.1 Acetyltransferase (GNAT) family protein [Eubacterium uniforme]
MKFKERTLRLKNRKKCTLMPVTPFMAEAMIAYKKRTVRETYYSVFCSDEVDNDVEIERKIIISRLVNPEKCEMVAIVGGKVVGTCYICPFVDLRKVKHRASLSISVLKKYWGLGIANAMLEYTIELSREIGFKQIDIEVMDDNYRALSLYKKHGFVETGYRHNAYLLENGTYHDEILMYKEL